MISWKIEMVSQSLPALHVCAFWGDATETGDQKSVGRELPWVFQFPVHPSPPNNKI